MIHSRTSEPLADCALSHHHPGRPVMWSEFDKIMGRNVIRCGTVLAHRAEMRYIAIRREDGREVRMSCGPVAAWGTDR